MKNSKGFTLVELMVVLVIIGILATMAIPKFLGSTYKAKATECKPVLKEVYTLQSAFYIETNDYATDAEQLGFSDTEGTYFTYSVSNTTTELGIATLNQPLGNAAADDDVCIDDESKLHVSAKDLGGYLNITSVVDVCGP